jgi:hypothetical protein
MKSLLFAAVLLAAWPLAPAAAAPMGGEEIRARSTGGEFRGYGSTPRYHLEDFIVRLRPDGTAFSISLLRRRTSQNSGNFEEYRDIGSWRVEGNRLCLQFGPVHGYLSGCYGVDGIGGDHVRLTGPLNLEGTLGH